MEATALCESIFQFVGHGGPEHVPASNLPIMPSTKTERAGDVGEGATGAAAAAATATATATASTTRNGQPTTQPLPMEAERFSNTCTSPKHQVENEEIMRAFVGNKLGEYNMRGVEAGMAMVAVDNKGAGKTLHTKSRRQGRVDSRPYEKRPSRNRNKKESPC